MKHDANTNTNTKSGQIPEAVKTTQQMGKRQQRCFCLSVTQNTIFFTPFFPDIIFLKLSRVPNRGKALSAATTETRGSETKTETETVEVEEEDNHE